MKASRLFICYKTKKTTKFFPKNTRGICPLEFFNCEEMKPLHVVKTKGEAEAWLHKPAHSVPRLTPIFLEEQ